MKIVGYILLIAIGILNVLPNKPPTFSFSPWMQVISENGDNITVALYEGQEMIDIFHGNYQDVEQIIWDKYNMEIEWVNTDNF